MGVTHIKDKDEEDAPASYKSDAESPTKNKDTGHYSLPLYPLLLATGPVP
jgi:hypothetical protein